MGKPDHHRSANAIRVLAMDAVQRANSGHPGMPMGMADIATVLWQQFIRLNPSNPGWQNRDRFVLSNGHGAMLQYALLHLTGFDLSIEDLKAFRQLNSKTPGHPEFMDTPGVETTTGPLGQGLANAVGMAMAEAQLAATFNRDGFPIVDHYTYAFVGDGCLMEGISHEACSLAGTQGLGKLIVFWDDNGISIDGEVDGWFTDDTPARFRAYGWQVIDGVDGHDAAEIADAIALAQENTTAPTLIACRTQIGFGAPTLAGTAATHGAPLGAEEIAATRAVLGWEDAPFVIPQDIYEGWSLTEKGLALEESWQAMWEAYAAAYPDLAADYDRRQTTDVPSNWSEICEEAITTIRKIDQPIATRKASWHCLQALGPLLPELMGGSADLSGSNCTAWSGSNDFSKDNRTGNYVRYGVREFGMAAIMNGMALHGGLLPYGGTFLTFLDYMRNAVRLSAMMQQRIVYVFTHDSIGLGEDGPTHQPVEHAALLRLTPGVHAWRPADATETMVAWQQAITYQGPSCLLLTRQSVPPLSVTDEQITSMAQGGYVLSDVDDAQGILIATGSEVELALQAQSKLGAAGIRLRVVSMPCAAVFLQQSKDYQESVLPASLTKRVAIEAAAEDYWYRFVGLQGAVIGLSRFGVSAPAADAYAYLGITVEAIVDKVQYLLNDSVTASSKHITETMGE